MESPKPAKRSACRTLLLVIAWALGAGPVLWCLVVWIGGFSGPGRGARLVWANLYNIRSLLFHYEELTGSLPLATEVDGGSPISWRVATCALWPARTSNELVAYDRTKPWNDATNLRLESSAAWYFRHPEHAPEHLGRGGEYGSHTTYYKTVTGSDTAFSSARVSLDELPNSLVLVVQVERSDTHWMAPGDLNVEELTPTEQTRQLLLGKHGYGVLFRDGPWVLSAKTPIEDLCKFFTVTGAKEYDREQLLGPYRVR
jgi:hypothetical protein